MNDYLSFYEKSMSTLEGFEPFLSFLFLGLGRLLPIIALSPFLGARVLPHPVKMVFAFMLFVIFLPAMAKNLHSIPMFTPWLILLMVKEVFIGFSIGLIISVPFIIVQNVGMLIDHQRGGASLLVNDPTIQNQSSPIGTLYNMILIVLFFAVDGPFYLFNAIIESYDIIPPDALFNAAFFAKDTPFWKIQIELFNKLMVITVQLGAPALIVILMTDMFLGIANRLAPQVQITFLGLPLKSLLALLVISLGFKLYNQQTIIETMRFIELLTESIHSMGIGK